MLQLAARHGPLVLVAGLVVGLSLSGLAQTMQPFLAPMVIVLLFITVLRLEPASILGSLAGLPRVVLIVLTLQLFLPLVVLAIGMLVGGSGSSLIIALLIMMAAPSISGSPNLCLMLGHDPAHAMRILVIGTALVPLTALPVFWLVPQIGDVAAIFWAAVKLFLTIAFAVISAITVRLTILKEPSSETLTRLEGLANITLAVFVIGLMPSLSAAAFQDPTAAVFWLLIAFAANFGAQFLALFLTRSRLPSGEATAVSIIAGNRNCALFFVSLPPEAIAPVIVFISAYQIPMYLTPLILRKLYRASS